MLITISAAGHQPLKALNFNPCPHRVSRKLQATTRRGRSPMGRSHSRSRALLCTEYCRRLKTAGRPRSQTVPGVSATAVPAKAGPAVRDFEPSPVPPRTEQLVAASLEPLNSWRPKTGSANAWPEILPLLSASGQWSAHHPGSCWRMASRHSAIFIIIILGSSSLRLPAIPAQQGG